LDQQGGHGVGLRYATGELEGTLGQTLSREHLTDHAEAVCLVHAERVPGEQELLGLPGAELPRVPEVLNATHAEPGADDVGELGALGGDDEVAGPHEHEAGRIDLAVNLSDGDLPEIAPPECVAVKVVPLLEHP